MSRASHVARQAVRGLQRLLPRATGGLCVLEYHLVGAGSGAAVDIPEATFRAHLAEIARSGPVLPLLDAVCALRDGTLPAGAVALTFDDAYLNFYEVVYPILQAGGIPATLFVPTGFVLGGEPGPIRGVSLPPCTSAMLGEMASGGLVEIGAHTVTHPTLTRLPAAAAAAEVRESKLRLEEALHRPARVFAYPRDVVAPAVRPLVRDLFDAAVTGGGGRSYRGRFDRHEIQRVPLRSDSPESIGALLGARVWIEERVAYAVRPLVK